MWHDITQNFTPWNDMMWHIMKWTDMTCQAMSCQVGHTPRRATTCWGLLANLEGHCQLDLEDPGREILKQFTWVSKVVEQIHHALNLTTLVFSTGHIISMNCSFTFWPLPSDYTQQFQLAHLLVRGLHCLPLRHMHRTAISMLIALEIGYNGI